MGPPVIEPSPPRKEVGMPVIKELGEVQDELNYATSHFKKFNSAHEGYGVILEELDELWEEIKKKKGERNIHKMRSEAKQVAAMAVRFMTDICGES